ncbi:hypothetical protein [Actinoplanes awajinensis]|uniref:Uncharacterized protein n=1 Tax=Actinoplanes awajinensis subsp. mycoplanecinus TaxID=135947 RepID=A0A124G9N2_9ACTN|nr:hypothetical protein [Actinoplanes awajinensis]KUL29680.1 hypothetical protein ADL15_26575 [Actinoplanes awajinensis subsp. mycoplanecinus]
MKGHGEAAGPRERQPRDDLVRRAAPLLPEGAPIRQVFVCQSAPSFLFFVITYVTGLTMFWIKYRCVAVTDDAIYVLESTTFSGGADPRRLIGTLPRRTRLGPVRGRWAKISLRGETCWVHRRFHAQITAADETAGFAA